MEYTKNSYGLKDSVDQYRTVKGVKYEQWSWSQTKEECQKEYPNYNFITRNGEVYREVK